MATPDWLNDYAKQQGWDAQPTQDDIDDLGGTLAALKQPNAIVDNDTGQPVVGSPQYATPTDSKLIDLPHGGSIVQDPDGYAALVQRPESEKSSYGNTLDSTTRGAEKRTKGVDLEDYKKYLALTQKDRAEMMATSEYQPDVNASSPKAHALLAAGVDGINPEESAEIAKIKSDTNKAKAAHDEENARRIQAGKPTIEEEKRKHDEENARRIQAGKPTIEEEARNKARAAAAKAHVGANFAVPTDEEDEDDVSPRTLQDLPDDLSDLQKQAPLAGNELGAPDPYAKLRSSQVKNYVDPLQAQVQAEKTGGVSAEDEEANKAAIQQANNPPPFNPDERDQYRGNGTGTKSAPDDSFVPLGPANPNPIDPETGQPVQQKPPQPQPTYVPGGWARTISPAALGMASELEQGRAQHAVSGAQRATELAAMQEQIYAQRSAELQAQKDAMLNEQRRQAIARDKAQEDYDHAQKLASAAKIEPGRIFQDKGAAIFASLGAALGAFGASLTHSPNFALETINKAIDTDMEAQKANAANARSGAENAWQKLKLATGSAEQADNMYRLAALQATQSKLSELQAGPAQRAAIASALEQAQDNIRAKGLALRMGTEKPYAGYTIGGDAGAGEEVDDKHSYIELPTDFEGHKEGTRYIVPKEQFGKISASTAAYGTAKKELARINGIAKDWTAYIPGSTANNEIQSAINNVVENYSRVGGIDRAPSKAMVNHFREQLESSVWNLAGGASIQDRTGAAQRGLDNVYGGMLHTYAPPRGHETLTQTPHGVRPGSEYTGDIARRPNAPPGFTYRKGGGTPAAQSVPYKPSKRVVTETTGKGGKVKEHEVSREEEDSDESD